MGRSPFGGEGIYLFFISLLFIVVKLYFISQKMNQLKYQLKALEEKLLEADLSLHPEIIDELISDDFEEVGDKGKVSSRAEVVSWLIKKDKNLEWVLDEFKLRSLTSELVLLNYVEKLKNSSNEKSKSTLRSSLWRNCNDRWQMVFHQATKII